MERDADFGVRESYRGHVLIARPGRLGWVLELDGTLQLTPGAKVPGGRGAELLSTIASLAKVDPGPSAQRWPTASHAIHAGRALVDSVLMRQS